MKTSCLIRSEDLIICESLAQDYCSSSRRRARLIVGYATVSTTQKTDKKTSQCAYTIKSLLLSSTLIVSSALCLSSCDDSLEPGLELDPEQRKSTVISAIEQPPDDLIVDKQEPLKDESEVLQPVVRQQANNKQTDFTNKLSGSLVSEENQRKDSVVLDFSLNFEQMDLTNVSNDLGGKRQGLLRGIFESEGVASNVELETHFAWPHNENKEMETTPDGAGIKLKMDF